MTGLQVRAKETFVVGGNSDPTTIQQGEILKARREPNSLNEFMIHMAGAQKDLKVVFVDVHDKGSLSFSENPDADGRSIHDRFELIEKKEF